MTEAKKEQVKRVTKEVKRYRAKAILVDEESKLIQIGTEVKFEGEKLERLIELGAVEEIEEE